ncbi:MAG TPA: hypothetical protein VIG30_17335 [Ktedonobacterales bacterium]|jgi:hypothetical protein
MTLSVPHSARRRSFLGFSTSPDKPDERDTRPSLPIPIVFDAPEASRARWEYTTLVVDPREEAAPDPARLNALGAEGWLLAAVVPVPVSASAVHLTYYFVREAVEARP